MSAPKIGAVLVEQNPLPTWRQGYGWTSEYAYEGTRAEVDIKANQYAGAAGVMEVRYADMGGGLYRVTVAFAGQTAADAQSPANPNDLVEVTWAFPRNDLQRDLWTHPRVEAQLARMTRVYRGRFRADVEAWLNGTTSVEVPTADGSGVEEVELSHDALVDAAARFGANREEIGAFLDALSEGQQTYIYSRRVLRVTRTGPTAGTWLQANTNTNRVYTKGRVIAELSPPAWVQAKMAAGYWFKHEPEEQQAGTKLEMVQEFEWFDSRYSTFAYGAAIA